MHEIQLVNNLFDMLSEEFPGRMEQLRTVHVTVGLLSNVQPILLQNAFEAVLQTHPAYAQVQLKVEVLPIIIRCHDCNSESTISNSHFVCAACGSVSWTLIQGEEMQITKVEFENP